VEWLVEKCRNGRFELFKHVHIRAFVRVFKRGGWLRGTDEANGFERGARGGVEDEKGANGANDFFSAFDPLAIGIEVPEFRFYEENGEREGGDVVVRGDGENIFEAR